MGGECDGGAVVADYWENQQWGGCRDCVLREQREVNDCGGDTIETVCQVLVGQEELRECPALIEKIAYEGTRLYGVNKPPPRRMGWRR